jgi:peptidoglycan/LPS O-acetylase OafA/YrhL
LVCAVIYVGVFWLLKHFILNLSKDAAISISADATLLLQVTCHNNTKGVEMKKRAARMCLLSALSCLCWLVCMGNRNSSNVIFESLFMILMPFVGGLMNKAFGWYFRQREVPDSDIHAVDQFFWLHLILVFAGGYSLQYFNDVDDTKKSLADLQVC